MELYSIEYIPGKKIRALGIVKGTVVQTKHIGSDFMAGLKTLVGGEIPGYTKMINEAREIAQSRLVEEAGKIGADAIIGIRYASSELMPGAAEIMAYGTAVKILGDE